MKTASKTHKSAYAQARRRKPAKAARGRRSGARAEKAAEQLVEQAAQGVHRNAQHRSLLQDQRDRTTGADQATRNDMSAKEPATLVDTSGRKQKRIKAVPKKKKR